MRHLNRYFFVLAIAITILIPTDSIVAQRRRVVVRPTRVVVRRPVVHTRLVVRPGYPIRRVLPTTVVVRPARNTVVVGAPLVYSSPLIWTPTVVATPPSDRLVWQDTEQIERDEGWVDTNFGIDARGHALFLDINGQAKLSFGEVTFANGNVQVVDFNERTHGSGLYNLLDFSDGRHVKTVRIIARSESDNTKLVVYLSR